MNTGSSADDVLKPDWFAYEQMAKFLQIVYSPRKTKSSEVKQSDTEYCDTEYQDQASTNVDQSENSTSLTIFENPTPNTSNCNTFKAPGSAKGFNNKKRKSNIDEKERRMEEAYNYLKDMRDKPDDDKCSLFSELLCQKLRALDENMRDIAMHEIDCLMFRFRQQQYNSGPGGYFQQQVPSSPVYQFSPYSYSQSSPIAQQYPEPQSQLSHSHSQPSPVESQSSSLSRSLPDIQQFSDESYEERMDFTLKE
ncbi:hypothetical protein CBL_02974 [Carabus blaptoides fortunei]